jgi:hypothetical protein
MPARKSNLWPFKSSPKRKRVVLSPAELKAIGDTQRAAMSGDLAAIRAGKLKAKRNAVGVKKVIRGGQSAGRDALKLYDNVGNAVWAVTGGIPRRIAGVVVGEKNNSKRKRGNPRNPQDGAERMYESFHGKKPEGETIVKEELHQHEHLAPLGLLVSFKVITMTGVDMTLGTSDAEAERLEYDESAANEDSVFLAANEGGTQLYFVGGDQSFPLDRCKMGESTDWYRDDMIVGVLYEVTYRTKKKFDKFKLTDYFHHLGEETGDQPMLRYDPLSPHLYVSGGKYKIKMPLIGMSPGIEN